MHTISVAGIAQVVGGLYGVPVGVLLSRHGHRRRDLVRARQEVAWLARQLAPGRSLAVIGRALGGREASTVRYGIRQVEWRLAGGDGAALWWLLDELRRTAA